MNVHLKDNGFLRSVFYLDEAEIEDGQKAKGNRFERVCLRTFSMKNRADFLLANGE